MMVRQLYPLARDFAEALGTASRDGKAWSRAERAALTRIKDRELAPVLRTRRRQFFALTAYAFVVERKKGGGYAVARVPLC